MSDNIDTQILVTTQLTKYKLPTSCYDGYYFYFYFSSGLNPNLAHTCKSTNIS